MIILKLLPVLLSVTVFTEFWLEIVDARPESPAPPVTPPPPKEEEKKEPAASAPPPTPTPAAQNQCPPAASPPPPESTNPPKVTPPAGPPRKSVNDGIQKTDEITKSKSDPRQYRYIKLKNEFQLLLVSDPAADMAAAAVAVNAGWLCDHKKMPGSMHFLEHMLFMGSKKYPKEDEYSSFIADHSGFDNAYTSSDVTNYYCEVSTDALADTVDRLAQFFLEPLMLETSIEKEAKNVDSEYQMHFAEDGWRLYLLQVSLSKKDHPFNDFYLGNLETVYTKPMEEGINIRDLLMNELYKKWYSANIMTGSMYGKGSLDELEGMAVPLFENVANINVTPLSFKYPEDHPWGPEQLKKKIFAVPVADTNEIQLIFAVSDVIAQYKTGPDNFLTYLIGYGGPGSLLSLLKEKDYISISSDYSYTSYDRQAGFGFFTIKFSLTPQAVDLKSPAIDEIIVLIFQYIRLVKEQGIQEWIFKENRRCGELAFMYKDLETTPGSYITDIAGAMPYVRVTDILSYTYMQDEWTPKLIEDFLSLLVVENVNVMIVSQSFKDIATEKEKWFETQYKTENFKDDLIKKCTAPELHPNLQLPVPNELLPDNFDLLPPDDRASKIPTILHDAALSRFLLLQDTEFKVPKVRVIFEILSPVATSSPSNRNLLEIYAILFTDSMTEYSYIAGKAGLSWSISTCDNGLEIDFFGYNQKMPILIEKIVTQITTFKIDEKRLKNLKEGYIRDLNNFETKDLQDIADSYLYHSLREKTYHNNELLKCTDVLECANIEKFRKEYFQKIFIQGYIHGNCNKEKGTEIVTIIEKAFKDSKSASADEIASLRMTELSEASDHIIEKPNTFRPNSLFYGYYQIGPVNIRDQVLVELLVQILAQPMFNQLRTQEQLGYYVKCFRDWACGVIAFLMVIEGEKHPTLFNSRAEAFILSMQKTLNDMTDKDFETEKKSLETDYLIKPKSLSALSSRYWLEVETRFYEFDRFEKKVKELKSIKKADVLEFYKKITDKTRRKLHIHVISEVTKPEVPKDCPEEKCTAIEDTATFKKDKQFYPCVVPCNEIQPLGAKAAEQSLSEKDATPAAQPAEKNAKPAEKPAEQPKEQSPSPPASAPSPPPPVSPQPPPP